MNLTSRLVCSLGLAAAAFGVSATDIAPGVAAPTFQLNEATGSSLKLQDLKGQVVLLNFWASWCGPCRQEMPLLDQMYRKYKAAGVTLVGINVEPNSNDAKNWLKTTPVTFPILFDTDSTVSKLYQVAGMPSTVILDRKGNVRYVHRGYTPGDESQYQDQLRALMRE